MVAPSATNTRSSGAHIRHARVQPILPIIQQPQPLLRRAAAPRRRSRPPCARTRTARPRADACAPARSQRRHREIFVVGSRQALALGVCGAQRVGVGLHPTRAHRQERYCTGDCTMRDAVAALVAAALDFLRAEPADDAAFLPEAAPQGAGRRSWPAAAPSSSSCRPTRS